VFASGGRIRGITSPSCDDVVYEPVLVREAVVVWRQTCDSADSERSDRRATALPCPPTFSHFGVLIEHRVHDVDECFRRNEQSWRPSADSLEPAWQVCSERISSSPSGASRSSREASAPSQVFASPRQTAPSRFDRGFVRRTGGNCARWHWSFITSRSRAPITRVAPAVVCPGLSTAPCTRGSRHAQVLEQRSAVGVRIGAHAPSSARR